MKKLKVFESAEKTYKKEDIDSIANILNEDKSRKLIVVFNDKSKVDVDITANEWEQAKGDDKLKDLAIEKINS